MKKTLFFVTAVLLFGSAHANPWDDFKKEVKKRSKDAAHSVTDAATKSAQDAAAKNADDAQKALLGDKDEGAADADGAAAKDGKAANPDESPAKTASSQAQKPTARELMGTTKHSTSTPTPMPASADGPSARSQPASSGTGPDIVGIRLGMSADEVRAVLESKSVSYIENDEPVHYPAMLPGTKPEPYEHHGKRFQVLAPQNPGNPVGSLNVVLTPEAIPKVYFVERTATYQIGTTAARPWRDAVIEKYGKPAYDQHVNRQLTMSWATGSGRECGRAPPGIGFGATTNLDRMIETCGDGGLYATASYSTGSAASNVELDNAYLTSFSFKLVDYGTAQTVSRQMAAGLAKRKGNAQAQFEERARTQAKPEL